MADPFIAEIRMWACNFAPRGWALCYGGEVSIEDNMALFALIGTLYGGDGRSTTGLPDLQGRVPMQWGEGRGLPFHDLGERRGITKVTLSGSQIPSHDHVLTGVRDSGTSGEPGANLFMGLDRGADAENLIYLTNTESANTMLAGDTLAISGGGQPHENRQPYLALNFCIALVGIWPPRG